MGVRGFPERGSFSAPVRAVGWRGPVSVAASFFFFLSFFSHPELGSKIKILSGESSFCGGPPAFSFVSSSFLFFSFLFSSSGSCVGPGGLRGSQGLKILVFCALVHV